MLDASHTRNIHGLGDQIARVDIARPDNAAPDQTEVYNFYSAWNII